MQQRQVAQGHTHIASMWRIRQCMWRTFHQVLSVACLCQQKYPANLLQTQIICRTSRTWCGSPQAALSQHSRRIVAGSCSNMPQIWGCQSCSSTCYAPHCCKRGQAASTGDEPMHQHWHHWCITTFLNALHNMHCVTHQSGHSLAPLHQRTSLVLCGGGIRVMQSNGT